ncbi:MAG TPA: B12-binding domain-containing protein [Miltoncostaeaceae bacterium]|nr:B12-binding domain-containing protein [Miltoncostaeaceae bacterium]
MDQAHGGAYLRIGELSRRVGVAPDTLRAWERRYGLLRPERTEGGFRLYSDDDERRIRDMQANLAAGLAPAQAARRAVEADDRGPASVEPPEDPIAVLREALENFDEARAHAAIDRMLAAFSLDSVLSHVVMPYLRDLGDRWERGEISVAQEHFASNVIRSRLLTHGRGWDTGGGPRALLACAPDELHDIGLVCLGLALRGHGWRVTLIGAATPVDTVTDAARRLAPDVVVVAANEEARLRGDEEGLRRLAAVAPLVLAGPGATRDAASRVGARLETGDPVTVARRIAETAATNGTAAAAI